MSYFTGYFWDGVIFMCTFFISKNTGILPSHVNGKVLTVEKILHRTASIGSNTTADRPLYIFGILYIVLSTFLITSWKIYVTENDVPSHFEYDFELNRISSYFLIINALLFRRKSTLKCIFNAAKLYCMYPPSLKPCWFILLSMFLHCILLVCVHIVPGDPNLVQGLKTLLIQLTLLPTYASVLLICCICLVAERSFINTNHHLEELRFVEPSDKTREELKILMFHHESTSDLIDELGETFSSDLVIHLADFTVQLIFCSYSVTSQVISASSDVSTASVFVLRLYKFFMICYCSQQVQRQVEKIRINIHSIKVHWLTFHCPDQETLLTGTAGMYASAALQYYWQDKPQNN